MQYKKLCNFTKRVKKGKVYYNYHPDCEYAKKKIAGREAHITYLGDKPIPQSRMKIMWISKIARYKIIWYNVVLYLRFVARNLLNIDA